MSIVPPNNGDWGLKDPAGLDTSDIEQYINSQQAQPGSWSLGGYTFDAWLRLHHSNSLTITGHPVQAGANIADHAFVNPKRFSFYIGVSDVRNDPNFPNSPTRSINAYQVLRDLQASRKPLTLVSKYGIFNNILIENFDAEDDYTTQTVLKAPINLQEIFIAGGKTVKTSLSPQVTDTTNRGQVPPLPEPGTWEAIKADINAIMGRRVL